MTAIKEDLTNTRTVDDNAHLSIRAQRRQSRIIRQAAEAMTIAKAAENPGDMLADLLHRGVDVDDIGEDVIVFTVPGTRRTYEWHLVAVTDEDGSEVDE